MANITLTSQRRTHAKAYDHFGCQDDGASVQNFSDAPGKPIGAPDNEPGMDKYLLTPDRQGQCCPVSRLPRRGLGSNTCWLSLCAPRCLQHCAEFSHPGHEVFGGQDQAGVDRAARHLQRFSQPGIARIQEMISAFGLIKAAILIPAWTERHGLPARVFFVRVVDICTEPRKPVRCQTYCNNLAVRKKRLGRQVKPDHMQDAGCGVECRF